ncbi:MAG: T9SS type A sorting domain-containing protein [candidate division WOR-3 bacterium]
MLLLSLCILLQWDPDFRLTNHSFIDRTSPNFCKNISIDRRGNIHVVWEAYLPRWRLFYRKYNGTIWLPETLLVTGVEVVRSQFPTILPDTSNNLHLVFEDERSIGGWQCIRIFYKKWDPAGWRPDTALTDSWAFLRPSLAIDTSNKLHLAMMQCGRPGKILYKRFNGIFWEKETTLARLKGADTKPFTNPKIITGLQGSLHLVWSDDTTGNYEIYYKKYNGRSWERDTMLTNCIESSVEPSVACDSRGRLHLVWQDFRFGTWDIFYKRFNGTSWEPETLLVSVDYIKEHPQIAVDKQDRLHLVWSDYRHGESEIYYKCYDGTGWSPDIRITNAPGHSREPFICIDDSNRLHLLWTDQRDGGNEEIYYKRLNITEIKEDSRWRITDNQLKIWPNPAKADVRLQIYQRSEVKSQKQEIRLKVYDITGKLVKEVCTTDNIITFRLSNPGIYFVKLYNDKEITTGKIVVIK